MSGWRMFRTLVSLKWIVVGYLIDSSRSGAKMSCGVHDCPQRCHQLFDHSKMACHNVVESVCSRNHRLSRPCFKKDLPCTECDTEDRNRELKRQRDHKLEVERELKQKEYARQLAELQDEIARERRILKDRFEQEEREKVLRQHQDDLANVRNAANRMKNTTMGGGSVPPPGNSASTAAASRDATTNSTLDTKPLALENQANDDLSPGTSSAKDEWEHQKKFEGVRNEALDS